MLYTEDNVVEKNNKSCVLNLKLIKYNNNKKKTEIEKKTNRDMLPETQCEAMIVRGATDFSIAAIMGQQTLCIEPPDKSSSKW